MRALSDQDLSNEDTNRKSTSSREWKTHYCDFTSTATRSYDTVTLFPLPVSAIEAQPPVLRRVAQRVCSEGGQQHLQELCFFLFPSSRATDTNTADVAEAAFDVSLRVSTPAYDAPARTRAPDVILSAEANRQVVQWRLLRRYRDFWFTYRLRPGPFSSVLARFLWGE